MRRRSPPAAWDYAQMSINLRHRLLVMRVEEPRDPLLRIESDNGSSPLSSTHRPPSNWGLESRRLNKVAARSSSSATNSTRSDRQIEPR